jgi:hypothetical protein
MVFRFQRRVRLAPGVRVNFGLRGMSLSLGPRGASMTLGSRGLYSNVGVPGTGLSMRQRVAGGSPRNGARSKSESPTLPGVCTVTFGDDGKTTMLDADGVELSQAMVRRLRELDQDMFERSLERAVELINADLHDCLGVHLDTPAPSDFRPLPRPDLTEGERLRLALQPVGFWDRLFLRRNAIERENDLRRRRHAEDVDLWDKEVARSLAQAERVTEINAGVVAGRLPEMDALLTERLGRITWPKETEVAFDFGDDSRTLELEVDLPLVDEIPHRTAAVPSRGINLKISKRSDAQRRRDFVRLVAGTCFRVSGEAFASLPTLEEVTVSGFTQRPDPATGVLRDV